MQPFIYAKRLDKAGSSFTDLLTPFDSISDFRKSLQNIAFDHQFQRPSISEIKLQAGSIYFANVFDSAVINVNARLQPRHRVRMDLYAFTLMSFNRGNVWKELKLPGLPVKNMSNHCPSVKIELISGFALQA